jgi:hypothetical protein
MSPHFDVFGAAGRAGPGGERTARIGITAERAGAAAGDTGAPGNTAAGDAGAAVSCRRLAHGLYPPVALWAPTGAGGAEHAEEGAGSGAGGDAAGTTVLWGWGLIRQAQGCGLDRIAAREVVCEPREAVLLMLELERGGRQEEFSWCELAAVVEVCGSIGVEVDPEISRAAAGDGALVAKVERFRALPVGLRDAVDGGRVDLRTAEQLAGYAADEAVEAVARSGGLSFSKRRQLLRVAVETLRRERRQPEDARGPREVNPSAPGGSPEAGGPPSLLELIDEALSQPDPVAALSRRRYPSLTELSDRLERIRSETIEKSGVELSAPPHFEGERYTVSFAFAGSDELDRRIAALQRLNSRTRELQDLL